MQKETLKLARKLQEVVKEKAVSLGFSAYGGNWSQELKDDWKLARQMEERVQEARQQKAYDKACENLEFKQLLAKAELAGEEAGQQNVPVPMTVVGGVPGEQAKSYYVSEGVCGFAWVDLYGVFAKWYAAYSGNGSKVWVSYGGQSMSRKEDYAEAFAAVLKEAGQVAYAGSRMD